MMKFLNILVCCIALGHSVFPMVRAIAMHNRGGGWGGPIVASRRDAEGPDVSSLVSSIQELLEKAKKGIDVGELVADADKIGEMAGAIEDGTEQEVDPEKVREVIDDVANKFNGATSVSALFDDPMDFDASKMDSALHLLDGLAAKAQEMQESGESLKDVLAAVEMTCLSMEDIGEDVEDFVLIFGAPEADEKRAESRKRGWKGSAGYSQNGGVNVGVSYSWRRR
ncbi:uncharacterized protein LOC106012812 [Aplysia californica]|uniref:Uncharacterized protein LOC106012812 n=1 Tax=Aplysia californica TaxID=6500 RepID=A0ABM1A7H5_APLCA|nr:uncharacterized protein LOC106012812 [Aplysia californica]